MNVNIIKNKQVYEIEAYVESSEEGKHYFVEAYDDGVWRCSCPQNTHKNVECKHIKAVKESI